MRVLIINAHGVVDNVEVVADLASYTPPLGYTAEAQTGQVWIGWRRINGAWVPPATGDTP